MLDHRLQRWSNIKPAQGRVFWIFPFARCILGQCGLYVGPASSTFTHHRVFVEIKAAVPLDRPFKLLLFQLKVETVLFISLIGGWYSQINSILLHQQYFR